MRELIQLHKRIAQLTGPYTEHLCPNGSYRYVCLGGLLVLAGLKAYQLFNHSSRFLPGLVHNKLILAGLIQAEVVLGLWLMVGSFARFRFVAAFICFGLFAVVASHEALRALPSCGCFGNVKVPPLAMAIFDGLAMVTLWFTGRRGRCTDATPPSQWHIFSGIIVAVIATSGFMDGLFPERGAGKTQGTIRPRQKAIWLI